MKIYKLDLSNSLSTIMQTLSLYLLLHIKKKKPTTNKTKQQIQKILTIACLTSKVKRKYIFVGLGFLFSFQILCILQNEFHWLGELANHWQNSL